MASRTSAISGATRLAPPRSNDRAQIVGPSYLAGHTVSRAFLYENGAMNDLCESLPLETRCTANDVNASGHVAATAKADGLDRRSDLTLPLHSGSS